MCFTILLYVNTLRSLRRCARKNYRSIINTDMYFQILLLLRGIVGSFVVKDDIEVGSLNAIPLWLFGFLY